MKNKPSSSSQFKDYQIRVFVSSTFRDMHAERDELVLRIFPQLRKMCKKRGVDFKEVDLRWGITEEQSKRGEVLPVCLAEIERCRPYFICHLGERYGDVAKTIEEDLVKDHPWLEKHKEKSYTDLEIVHGVLENPEMKRRAFFYFRDPAVSKEVEKQLEKESDYIKEPESYKAKLDALKDEICKSGYPRKDYSDARTFGELVLKDLWAAIDERFPEGSQPTEQERERMDNEAFAEVRRKVYIGRDEYYRTLDDHVTGEGEPLVITGESGIGKSALISNWMEKYREENPDVFLLARFIGGTAESADYVFLLRSIMMEIKDRYEPKTKGDRKEDHSAIIGEKEDDILTDPKKVVEAFPRWLANAATREANMGRRFILILDGLNQLDDRDNAPDLGWLPEFIPKNVRLILSTLPGRSLDALQRRKWPQYEVKPMNPKERLRFIIKYLEQFTKELSRKHRKPIFGAPQAANPLYLRTLLEELRVFGVYKELEDRIGHYLKAETVENLFEKVLERYEDDYERDRPGLMRDAMSLIWASRRGLSEDELLELLGPDGEKLPQAFWSPLYLATEESLVSRSGLLNFFHDFLRNAVEGKYLKDQEKKQNAHLHLAGYFEKQELDDRKVDELPWQLRQAEHWERLKDCVTKPEMFLKLFTDKKQYELTGSWLDIGDRFDMVDTYNTAIEEYESSNPVDEMLVNLLNQVANFFLLNARYDGAEPLFRRALEIDEASFDPDHPHVATSLNDLALLLRDTNRYSEAEPLFRRALKIVEASFGPDHPNVAIHLNNLANLLTDTNRHTEAEPLFRRALKIIEASLAHHSHVATNLNDLALLLRDTNRYSEAEPLFRRALKIYETSSGPDHPSVATILKNLALLLQATNRMAEAEPLFRRALKINEASYGPDHPKVATVLNTLALLLDETNRYSEAEPLYRRALKIDETSFGPDHPGVAAYLNNLAALLHATNRLAEAEPLYHRVLKIDEASYGPDHPNVANGLNNLAELLRATNRHAKAEPLYRRALKIEEASYGSAHPRVATRLNNLALLLKDTNRMAEAEPLLRRALKIAEASFGPDHPDTVAKTQHLANILRLKGDNESAMSLYKKALKTYEKKISQGIQSTPQILFNIALCHNELAVHFDIPAKKWKDAEFHFQQTIELFKKVPNPTEVANAELNLQTTFHLSGQTVDINKVKEATRILEEAKDKRAEKGRKLLTEDRGQKAEGG